MNSIATKITRIALLLTFVSGLAFAQDAPCGFRCVFGTGPNRPPAVEDIYDADFDTIFGAAPVLEGGKRVNIRDMAEIETWRQNRRQFGGLIDFEVDEQVVFDLFEATQGGFPVAWKDVKGQEYVAFIGVSTPLYRLPTFWFTDPNFGFVQSKVYWQLVMRGGCIPKFPTDAATLRNLGMLRARNDANCASKPE